jgi:phosphoribosylaminoimidazolecarboxamide formyltransferase/IMP cyclohydrolase
VITDPEDYEFVMKNWPHNLNRMKFAKRAFRHTCEYDGMILEFFSEGREVNRIYEETSQLKYGCNPFQTLAAIHSVNGSQLPFNILNGSPGYINILDAVGCWGLVNDLSEVCSEVLGKYVPASCSFKHTSPAGAAIGTTPLSQIERHAFYVSKQFDNKALSELCTAYIRARHSDPLSSFGDFIGVSGVVDEELANLIRIEVCDGIIAAGYTEEALQILGQKKGGRFIILQGDKDLAVDRQQSYGAKVEFREIGGLALSQKPNNELIKSSDLKIVTESKDLPDEGIIDLLVANTTLKYTQSNSVAIAFRGQTIGVGAGQQSRVHCVQLAAQKAQNWRLRFHPKTLNLPFKNGLKRQAKINATFDYLNYEFTEQSHIEWLKNFDLPSELPIESVLQKLEDFERKQFLQVDNIEKLSIASDAFFPFRDSLDVAAKVGCKYVAQPGGSVRDEDVIQAANNYRMIMCFTGKRMFTH